MNKQQYIEKDLPKQQQETPGRESEMNPTPEVIRKDYRGSGKLEGKIALITGGDSGIGRAVGVHFAREGAKVAIIYLEENDDARDTQSMIEEEGSECLLLPGDIRDKAFCDECINKVRDHFGALN